MVTTPNLGLTLLEQSQSQKEITINENLLILDAVSRGGVIDKDLSTPPGSPSVGDSYIVASSPTGAWTGHAKHVAIYTASGWRFLVPGEGLFLWVNDEDVLYVYDGSVWTSSVGGALSANFLGINTTADATNRLSVTSQAVLFTAETDDIQVKLSKDAAGDTASFLFQTNFSGRAEFGTTGDDDFHFKVSPDGSAWYESFIIDKDNGDLTFKQKMTQKSISSGYAGSAREMDMHELQTTTSSTTVIASFAVDEGEMICVHAFTLGLRDNYDEAIGARQYAFFRRDTGGNVTIIGTLQSAIVEDSAGTNVTIAANTTAQTVEVRVTGENAKTINWTAFSDIMRLKTNA